MKIAQIYASTTTHTDDEIDIFYGNIEKTLTENHCYYTFLILVERDETQTLIDFVHNRNLYIMNSFFKKTQQMDLRKPIEQQRYGFHYNRTQTKNDRYKSTKQVLYWK